MTAQIAPAAPIEAPGPLDALIARYPLSAWRKPAWVICSLLGVALIWSHFAKLDEVAIVPGEVVPQGQVKVIQHLEGGIIESILVREGQVVARGTPLAQLDLGLASANREDLQVQLAALGFKRTRLLAEQNAEKLEIAVGQAGSDSRLADVVKSEREAYESRRRQLDSTLAVVKSQQNQREAEVKETEAKRAGIEANLRLGRQRLAMARDLVARDLMPKLEHLEREREVETLAGQLAELNQTLPRVRAGLAEAYRGLGQLDEATEQYRAAAELAPADAMARVRIGDALRQQKKPIDALYEYEEALKMDPELYIVHFQMGLAYKDKELMPEATAAFERFIAAAPAAEKEQRMKAQQIIRVLNYVPPES